MNLNELKNLNLNCILFDVDVYCNIFSVEMTKATAIINPHVQPRRVGWILAKASAGLRMERCGWKCHSVVIYIEIGRPELAPSVHGSESRMSHGGVQVNGASGVESG